MDWTDLKLGTRQLDVLRNNWQLSDPRQVVKLAWGEPDVLGKVLSAPKIEKLRKTYPSTASDGVHYDSTQFSLGAQLGPAPVTAKTGTKGFEARRAKILSGMDRATDDKARSRLQSELVALYSTGAAGR